MNRKNIFCFTLLLGCLLIVSIRLDLNTCIFSNYNTIQTPDLLLNQSYSFVAENMIKQGRSISPKEEKERIITSLKHSIERSGNLIQNDEIPLNIFLEYVLPPYIDKEPIDDWKTQAYEEFAFLDNCQDLFFICDTINHYWMQNFEFKDGFVNRARGWKDYKEYAEGNCYDMSKMVLYPLRSLGIPSSIDFVIAWGNYNGSHMWNCVYQDGKMIPFMGVESSIDFRPFEIWIHKPDSSRNAYRYPPKIFRKTFSINQEYQQLKQAVNNSEYIRLFNDLHFVDVTKEYFDVGTISLFLPEVLEQVVFLAVYNNNSWIPIAATFNQKGNVLFEDVNKNLLYTVVNEYGTLLTPPFIYTNQYECQFLIPEENKQIDMELKFLRPRAIEYKNPFIDDNMEIEYEELMTLIAEDIYREKPINGKKYHLFQCNEKGDWIKIAETIAENETLDFKQVPANALFLIKDSNYRIKGRCFTYEEGKQIWL